MYGGHNLPPLVEIGLTDLPKFGGAMAPPAPPGTTSLRSKTAPRILISSIAMGANYSFYVKSIASYVLTLLGYNNSVLAIVNYFPFHLQNC